MKSKQLKVINPVPDITPFATSIILLGFQQKKWKNYLGYYFEETYSAHHNVFLDWCVSYPFWQKIGQSFFERLSSDKKFFQLVAEKHKEFGQAVYKKCDDILASSPRELTDKQLLADFKELVDYFKELCFWGVVPPVIDFENNLLTGFLEEQLTRALKKYKVTKPLQDIFSILTTPGELAYSQKEKDDLLKLAADKNFTDRKLAKHCLKYKWVDYGYLGPVYPISYYKRRLAKLKKDKTSPKKQLLRVKRDRNKIKQDQKLIAQQLHFNQKTKYIFQIAREFMALKLYRKEVMFKAYYVFDLMFDEISKRFGYSLKQLRYSVPEEIIKILKNQPVDKKELNKRTNTYFVHAYLREKNHFYYGQKARDLIKKNLYQEKVDTELEEVTGMTAFVGKAQGRVKIVNTASEIKKIRKGEVLVSIATSPSILPAMRLASAFVTDTGGITCHAAIVAREMKKPCVIGTKIATKVFKDGDTIEVDAVKGIVKKLK